MTLKELTRRVEKLRPHSIILLVRMPDGTEQRMSAREFVESGYDFFSARIIEGNSLDDARLLLSTVPSVIE